VWHDIDVTESDITQWRDDQDRTVTRASALAKLTPEEREVLGL
jgi:hypothetical protein